MNRDKLRILMLQKTKAGERLDSQRSFGRCGAARLGLVANLPGAKLAAAALCRLTRRGEPARVVNKGVHHTVRAFRVSG
jgi:hypothetical protein